MAKTVDYFAQQEEKIKELEKHVQDLQSLVLTVDCLQDKKEDLETLKEFKTSQRLALYNYLTARAYRLNKDELRSSALMTRDDLMSITRGDGNVIPFDRVPKKITQEQFMPDLFNETK